MGLFRRQYQIRLHQPITGSASTIQSLPPVAHQTPLMRIQPNDRIISAPLDGEIVTLSPRHLTITALNGEQFRLEIETTDYHAMADWQVRVGDSVSPLTILGLLEGSLVATSLVVSRVNTVSQQTTAVVANS